MNAYIQQVQNTTMLTIPKRIKYPISYNGKAVETLIDNFIQEIENKIKNLINKLNYYTKLYDEGKPEITDKEWDDLYFQLVILENKSKIYFEDSPTQKVNYQIVNQLNKVEHDHLMLSLDKTKDIDTLKSFINNKECISMAKMDGLTCSLTYENGKLVFLDKNEKEIGVYECTDKDTEKCYVAKLDYSSDKFERIKSVSVSIMFGSAESGGTGGSRG